MFTDQHLLFFPSLPLSKNGQTHLRSSTLFTRDPQRIFIFNLISICMNEFGQKKKKKKKNIAFDIPFLWHFIQS